jgi:hypothetical protein
LSQAIESAFAAERDVAVFTDTSVETPHPQQMASHGEPAPEPGFEPAPEAVFEPSLAPEEWTPVDVSPQGAAPATVIPEVIPPTPEPAALTAQTAPWFETPDPRAIVLPRPVVSASPTSNEPPPLPPTIIEAEYATPKERNRAVVDPPPHSSLIALDPSTPTASASEPARLAPDPEANVAESRPAVTPRHPEWPTAEQLEAPARRALWPVTHPLDTAPRAMWQRPWAWIVLVVALFAGGWLIGALQDSRGVDAAPKRGSLFGALGFVRPHYDVIANSRPPGAWIAVDGKHLTLRTPATLELSPGDHRIELSFSQFGSATFDVRGAKGDRVPLDAALWGSLDVVPADESSVISVSVDGEIRGFAPVRADSLLPGVHEVRFSGPGVASWGQTVDVRVGETKQMLTRPIQSPATGLIQVRAEMTDEDGTQPVRGGTVWVDGESRGAAPLMLELPRGPHSFRVAYKNIDSPVQVIDLPGGNQRFATFELGALTEFPHVRITLPERVPRDRPTVLAAALENVPAADVHEMWLHVRAADGPWRRYQMTLLEAPMGGVVGVAVFPIALFDAQGRARFYVSAQHGQGDESFSEIQTVLAVDAGRAGTVRGAAARR